MSLAEKRIKRANRIAIGSRLIAEQTSMDPVEIVRALPLDPQDRMFALEVLRRQKLRQEREMIFNEIADLLPRHQ